MQVIHDCGQAHALIVPRGCSDAGACVNHCNNDLYGKACARRGEAFLLLGNLTQASMLLRQREGSDRQGLDDVQAKERGYRKKACV